MKSSSHRRGLGGAEGGYKHVGADERRGVGRSGVTAGIAGTGRRDLHQSGVLEKGDPQLMGPALLPALENRPGPRLPELSSLRYLCKPKPNRSNQFL